MAVCAKKTQHLLGHCVVIAAEACAKKTKTLLGRHPVAFFFSWTFPLAYHKTIQVCGLKWSPDGNTLASGGNENFLCLWDASMSGRAAIGGRSSVVHRPRKTLEQHVAAVKALAWCPTQRHLLASGGGTADRSIKVGDH